MILGCLGLGHGCATETAPKNVSILLGLEISPVTHNK